MHQPTLILIRGLPGSGKSYLASALQKALGEDKVILLDPDATDYDSGAYQQLSEQLSAEGVDKKFHPYRFLRGQAHRAIAERKSIIWNQAFTNLDGFNKTVINLQAFAKEHDTDLPVLVVEVEVSHETAKHRVAARADNGGHDVSEAEFERFFRDYQSFADKGYRVVRVNGEGDIEQSVATVIDALQ